MPLQKYKNLSYSRGIKFKNRYVIPYFIIIHFRNTLFIKKKKEIETDTETEKMTAISFVAGNNKLVTILAFGILLILHSDLHQRPRSSFLSFTDAKEIIATKEWQLLGVNDTVPAGLHLRMDMTTGEKWAKIMDDEDDEDDEQKEQEQNELYYNDDTKINSERRKESASALAVIKGDGATINQDFNSSEIKYDFDMMHRTLSKLPDEEKESMGLPELPQPNDDESSKIAFKRSMVDIWKLRQERLARTSESMVNFPEVLKARIASIEKYLEDPETQLISMNLDDDESSSNDNGVVTHIVSVLKDLEFQLTDLDLARDFHTMGGWPFLVQLVSDESHVPGNKKIHELSRSVQTKIRTVQAYAAWAIGTAVKNTEEFFPYSTEKIVVGDGKIITTPIELLIDSFCKEYNDSNSWEIRTLLSKNIYAIGSILRGNIPAQTRVVKTNGFDKLGKKYNELSKEGFNSNITKLIQRLAVLSIYIFEDSTDTNIIQAITSSDFCDATCGVLSSDNFLPVTVVETVLKAFTVLGPHCQQSSCAVNDFQSIIETIRSDWLKRKADFDHDHFKEILDVANEALKSIRGEELGSEL